jgi:hypothetical protein
MELLAMVVILEMEPLEVTLAVEVGMELLLEAVGEIEELGDKQLLEVLVGEMLVEIMIIVYDLNLTILELIIVL